MICQFDLRKNSIHIVSLSCNTVPPDRYGGIELVIANLCEGLRDLGLSVKLYSPGATTISSIKQYSTIPEPTPPIKNGGLANTNCHLSAIEIMLRRNVKKGDIVLFNHADQYRFLKNRLGRIFFWKIKAFEIAHWLDAGLYKNVIYPARSLAKVIDKRGYLVPHGIDLKYGDATVKKTRDLFFAGRLTEDKGLAIALEAVKSIGCKLILAGPRHNSQFCMDLISDANVVYLGELNYSQLFEQYQTAKAQIYLTQYVEPFGLSVIEAMAAGSPVITTGLGGTGDTVIDGETGYFARTVEDVVRSYEKLDLISPEKCIERAKLYSKENMAKGYLDVFLGKQRELEYSYF